MSQLYPRYLPPAGTVEVAGDSSWTWNGREWFQRGQRAIPSGRQLQGKAGSRLAGWYYDWQRGGWIDPSAASSSQMQQITPLQQQQLQLITRKEDPMISRCAPAPEASVTNDLPKHPWLPLLALGAQVLPELLTPPQPPTMPQDLPPSVAAAWQLIFAANQQAYERRKALLDKVANVATQIALGNAQLHEVGNLLAGQRKVG